MLIATLLGNRQPPKPPSCTSEHLDLTQDPTELDAPLLPSALTISPELREKEPPVLLCQGLPPAREVMTAVSVAIHRAAVVVGSCTLACTFVSAVCAHMPKNW